MVFFNQFIVHMHKKKYLLNLFLESKKQKH